MALRFRRAVQRTCRSRCRVFKTALVYEISKEVELGLSRSELEDLYHVTEFAVSAAIAVRYL